jgi:type VI secretion system protein ImpK
MQRIIPTNSFLLNNFRDFYQVIEEARELALEKQQQPESADKTEEAEEKELLTHKIQRRLKLILEQQSLNAATQVGEFAVSHTQEAQYIMAALADEIFLNLDWWGTKEWEEHLLESQLFHSQIAGELFFKKIDTLLTNNDPTTIDLAILYLWCLNIGFKGMYRDEDPEKKINAYREQLYAFIMHQSPTLFKPGREHLFDQPYNHRTSLPTTKGFPEMRSWLVAFGAIFFIYIFISTVLWYKLARDINEASAYILQQAKSMGLS